MCPAFLTAYHTCTFNCDPRATAAAGRGGCPAGLACVMPAAMDEVDCACPEATRTKLEGDGLHAGRRLRPRPALQPDVGHEDLPPDLPLRRQRRGHLHRDGE